MTDAASIRIEAECDRLKVELTRDRQRAQNGAVRARRFGFAVSAALAALLILVGVPIASILILLLVISTLLWRMILHIVDDYDEAADRAAAMLGLLERELSDTESLLSFAETGAAYALFLRSFASEAEGLGRTGLNKALPLQARVESLLNRYDVSAGYSPVEETLQAHAKWTKEISIVEALSKHMPVVLLGNLRLAADMQADLERLGVKSLTVLAQNWYDIFTALAASTRLALFYVEQVSPSLSREIAYAAANNLDYVIVADERDRSAIEESFDGGAAFISSAKTALKPDHPDMAGALAAVISRLAH